MTTISTGKEMSKQNVDQHVTMRFGRVLVACAAAGRAVATDGREQLVEGVQMGNKG